MHIDFCYYTYKGRRTPTPPYHRRAYDSPATDRRSLDTFGLHSSYGNVNHPMPNSAVNDLELRIPRYDQHRSRLPYSGNFHIPSSKYSDKIRGGKVKQGQDKSRVLYKYLF